MGAALFLFNPPSLDIILTKRAINPNKKIILHE